MALFLAHGKLVYTFNQGQQRVKLRSQEKYNDGAWHNVSKSLSTIPHTHTHTETPRTVLVSLTCMFMSRDRQGSLVRDASCFAPVRQVILSLCLAGYFYSCRESGQINN